MDPLVWQQRLKPLLSPLGGLYTYLAALRRTLWERGPLPRYRPACPCVSVGNICWGGSGKTPLTGWLMDWAVRRGIRPVLLTRGYKADLSIVPVHVNPHHTARDVGDEPLMLARACPEGDVVVDPRRSRAAAYAERSLHPGLLLLDDGFQHLAVERDVDLVLLRPADVLEQWDRVLPAGSWREGRSALSRAHAFLIKVDPERMHELTPVLQERLAGFERPVFSFSLRPTGLFRVGDTAELTAETFGDRPYVLVSGVGDPQQVEETVRTYLGRSPEKHFVFPDHHHFLFRDAAGIAALNLPVICTDKDAVKLRHVPVADLWSLRVEVSFGPWLWCGTGFPDWWETRRQELAERYGVMSTLLVPEHAGDAGAAGSAEESTAVPPSGQPAAQTPADSQPISETPLSGDNGPTPATAGEQQETETRHEPTCRPKEPTAPDRVAPEESTLPAG